ncbi:unnamed protein product [Rhizoctonia solani]|uniref:Major facilitator superfamily (MFS) profile domain-containing protein n=1 Tax=Rhizoctonia solani TaxID=456999 RepID=A0A8H3BTJ0_9AGAM|nr:unnamed protein product [Rhizoctonia solani]
MTSNATEDDNDSEQHTSIDGVDDQCRQEEAVQKRTPLPVKQVLVLCLMSFSEPVSLLVIFPFVNQMIEDSGVASDPKEIGYYSGFVEGIFSVTQFFTIYFWGSLSDRIGRRPVLISGLCGVVGSTIMFGLSKSLMMMLVSRALSGMLNGNSAVIKSVMGEITDETNQGKAFAYLPLFWSLGALIAPALGGFLSHPADRYPSVFGFELFRRYPYFLPCLAGSAFSILGLVAGILFLEEVGYYSQLYLPSYTEDPNYSAFIEPSEEPVPRFYQCRAPTTSRFRAPNQSPDLLDVNHSSCYEPPTSLSRWPWVYVG